jgi:hypothetical protein
MYIYRERERQLYTITYTIHTHKNHTNIFSLSPVEVLFLGARPVFLS